MRTTLIVDAYNAINAIPSVKTKIADGLIQAREAIVSLSKEYARSSGYITDVRVVFDGKDCYQYPSNPSVLPDRVRVFSGTGKGDDKIIETVCKEVRKGRVVVASNDNYVRNNARAYGASVIRSEELTGGKKKKKGSKKFLEKKINKNLENKITAEYRRELGIE